MSDQIVLGKCHILIYGNKKIMMNLVIFMQESMTRFIAQARKRMQYQRNRKHQEEKHQKQTQLTPTLSTPATLHTKKAVPPNWTVVLCAIICK